MKKINKSITEIPVVPPKTTNREERKEYLQESVNKYLEAIETQIGDVKKVGKNTLVIGGLILSAYALTAILLPSNKQKNIVSSEPFVQEEENESFVWAVLKGIATSVLLTIAKNKLLEIIANPTTKDVEANS